MLRFPFLAGAEGIAKKSLRLVVEQDGRFKLLSPIFVTPRSSKVTSS